MEREEYIAYGIPFIILSVTLSGLGMYLSAVQDQAVFGKGLFYGGAVLTVALLGISMVPPMSSYLDEHLKGGKE